MPPVRINHEYYAVIPDKKWKGLSFKIYINSDPLQDSDPPIHIRTLTHTFTTYIVVVERKGHVNLPAST